MLPIFIPTSGRLTRQITLRGIPQAFWSHVTLVTPRREAAALQHAYHAVRVLAEPEGCRGIAQCRSFIADSNESKFVMMDDDLYFYYRKGGSLTRFTPEVFAEAMQALEDSLDEYAHAGIGIREFSQDNDDEEYNVRNIRCIAFRADVLREHGLRFHTEDPLFSMDDFHMTLQLLRRGYANRVFFKYVQHQAGSDVKGGAANWRTRETQAASAHALRAMHPSYVTVVEKTRIIAWDGEPRLDVKVAWKRAFEERDLAPRE